VGKALKTAAKAVVALLVSAFALWFAFRDVDLEYVRGNLGRTGVWAIASYIGLQLLVHVVRVWRYWLLCEPLGRGARSEGTPVSPRAVFASVSIGIPAAVFLPLRLGELVRPLLLTRAGAPIAGAFATVVVERVADGIFNVGLFFILFALLPAGSNVPSQLRSAALVMLVFFGSALVFVIAAYFMRDRVLGWFERIAGVVAPKLAHKAVELLSTFLDGLRALATVPRFLLFLALTIAYWGTNGYSVYLLMTAYGLNLPVISGWFAIACVVFAVTVPAGPAFAGTLEAGFRFGLAPFGVSASDTAVVSLLVHALTLVILAMFTGAGFLAAEPAQKRSAR
jgi:uncharacterized protein (TIRG00374 family)